MSCLAGVLRSAAASPIARGGPPSTGALRAHECSGRLRRRLTSALSPRAHAAVMAAEKGGQQMCEAQVRRQKADLGELVVVLLSGSLAGLRDRLWDDGFHEAADLVADLSFRCDQFLETVDRK